jgi:hypothetical protein
MGLNDAGRNKLTQIKPVPFLPKHLFWNLIFTQFGTLCSECCAQNTFFRLILVNVIYNLHFKTAIKFSRQKLQLTLRYTKTNIR